MRHVEGSPLAGPEKKPNCGYRLPHLADLGEISERKLRDRWIWRSSLASGRAKSMGRVFLITFRRFFLGSTDTFALAACSDLFACTNDYMVCVDWNFSTEISKFACLERLPSQKPMILFQKNQSEAAPVIDCGVLWNGLRHLFFLLKKAPICSFASGFQSVQSSS